MTGALIHGFRKPLILMWVCAASLAVVLIPILLYVVSHMGIFDSRPPLEISLASSDRSLVGARWPLKSDGTPLSMFACEGPRRLTIHFSTGRSYQCNANKIVISEHDEQIDEISFLPYETVMDFQTAVNRTEDILNQLERDFQVVSHGGHQLWKERIQNWKRDAPSYAVSDRVNQPDDGFSLFVEIKPYDVLATHPKEWYVVLTFSKYRKPDQRASISTGWATRQTGTRGTPLTMDAKGVLASQVLARPSQSLSACHPTLSKKLKKSLTSDDRPIPVATYPGVQERASPPWSDGPTPFPEPTSSVGPEHRRNQSSPGFERRA
jgi:hypothetical protein